MKAALYSEYGSPSVVSIQEVPKPAPKDNEILVKVMATPVTAADVRIRAARFPQGFGFLAKLAFGIRKPKRQILGSCFSGVVEVVGSKVRDFKPGDAVCGMNGITMGAHAEYLVVAADGAISHKPSSVSHVDAAGLVFGGTAALYFVRDQARLQKGESILVNGASGAVGTNAVQLAHYYGAAVTAVTSGANTQLVKELGATNTIDYTTESWHSKKMQYDVILDAVGTITPYNGVPSLTKNGRLVLMVASIKDMITSTTHSAIKTGSAPEKKADIDFLLDLLVNKKLKVVIDSVYPFNDIVAAHEHVDTGNKKGNVVVEIQ